MDILKIENFGFQYFNDKNLTLENINISIPQNQITTFIGASGSGKTTLLRSLNRIHDIYKGHKYFGKIFFKDKNILEFKDLTHLRQKIGMIFQKPTIFPMSIYENLTYGLKLQGKKSFSDEVENALKNSFLWNEVKDRLDSDATKLSGGQQQRLCIARAIAVKPEVLLLDEPTSSLDPISTEAIEKLILNLKKRITIVLVTHNLEQANRISDKIIPFSN